MVCWQATDKALENSRLFGITPCWSLWLASTGGILAKSFFTTVEKVEKIIFPLFFSVKMMVTRWLVSEIGERNSEKRKNFCGEEKKSAGGSPDVEFCLEIKSFRGFRISRRLHALDYSGHAKSADSSLVVTSFLIKS